MKVRVIYDNIDKCYYAQYKKWYWLYWKTFCEQRQGHWGACPEIIKFSSFERASIYIRDLMANKIEMVKLEKRKKELEKNRIEVCLPSTKVDINTPHYYEYHH